MNRNRPNRRGTKQPATNDPYHKTGWERAEELETEIKRQVRRIEELEADNAHLRDVKGVHHERPKKRGKLDGKSGKDLVKHGGAQGVAGTAVIAMYALFEELHWPWGSQHFWHGEVINSYAVGVMGWLIALIYKTGSKFD